MKNLILVLASLASTTLAQAAGFGILTVKPVAIQAARADQRSEMSFIDARSRSLKDHWSFQIRSRISTVIRAKKNDGSVLTLDRDYSLLSGRIDVKKGETKRDFSAKQAVRVNLSTLAKQVEDELGDEYSVESLSVTDVNTWVYEGNDAQIGSGLPEDKLEKLLRFGSANYSLAPMDGESYHLNFSLVQN